MEDFIGYIFVLITVLIFGYALVWQIRDTLALKRSTKWQTADDKRKLAGNYLMTISLTGFLISYVLNIVVGTLSYINPATVQHALVNSNSTGLACFLFLAAYFISRFAIVPKEDKGLPLLKAKM